MGASCGKGSRDPGTYENTPANLNDQTPETTRRSATMNMSPDQRRQSNGQRLSTARASASKTSAALRAKQGSNLTTRGSDDLEWSASDGSYVSNSTGPTGYGSAATVLRLTEDNLMRYDRMYQYRSGNNNAIKKILFQRLLEDSIRFSQMDPEPIPEEYLNRERERSSSRSDRSQRTATSGSGSTALVESPRESPSNTDGRRQKQFSALSGRQASSSKRLGSADRGASRGERAQMALRTSEGGGSRHRPRQHGLLDV